MDVRIEEESLWLTQSLMAELFQTTPQNITIHLKKIYEEGELDESSTCKEFLQVQQEGDRSIQRLRKFYNLDAIISVGYRIKSQIAARFWRMFYKSFKVEFLFFAHNASICASIPFFYKQSACLFKYSIRIIFINIYFKHIIFI